jgi:parvulin-like peptidyl-prolyl isomerase
VKAVNPAVAPSVNVAKADDKAPLPAGVVAKVGDWTLTQAEFSEKIKGVKEMVKDFNEKEAGAKAMLLNEVIRQQLLIQQARKEGLQDSKEIKTAMQEFENTLLVQEIVTRLTKDITATEEDAKKYYEANGDEFKKPLEKQLREIVLATETEAKDVLVQVLQGGDFAQIAKDKSKGKTKDNGGDLGFKTEASFPAMAAAVSTLNKGGVSAVFQGPDGFYIVKIEDVRGGDKVPYEEVKADLVKFLKLRQQQQALADKVKAIEQQIKVRVNEDLIKDGTGE